MLLGAKSVKADYDEMLSNPIIRFSAAESRCSTKIQLLRITGILVICAGVIFLHSGVRDMSLYNDLVSLNVDDDRGDVFRKTGITFRGKLLAAEDLEFNVKAPDFRELGLDIPEASTSYFIRLIDDDSARASCNKGIFLIFLGLAMAGAAMVLIYRKIEDYTDFNDELL